ncbi:MAG: nucleoside deaminase [Candidatus Pacearchaeota archaeon]
MEQKHPSKGFMNYAIEEAKNSAEKGQYALGAIVVKGGKIISVSHTRLHEDQEPSAHAEMNAIRGACKKTGSRYLEGAWLYTTQEPCPMCTSVAI